jgi:hypothetical protein
MGILGRLQSEGQTLLCCITLATRLSAVMIFFDALQSTQIILLLALLGLSKAFPLGQSIRSLKLHFVRRGC